MPEDRRHTTTEHKLAAIMFTDIVGYTALMGKDEDRAFEVLRINKEIHIKLIEKYKGTLIKEMGDGMLVSFNSSKDAVLCAIEIQNECKNKEIPLKIGIHEGDMVFSGNDVLGDGVNIASRLEAVTDTGNISVSEAIYRNVKNKSGIHTAYLEERILKNVDEPVRVYQVSDKEIRIEKTLGKKQKASWKKMALIMISIVFLLLGVIIIWKLIPSNSKIELERSIAVLPFQNASTEEGNQFFVDGMMEEIRNNLSMIADLRVVSKTSTEKYRDTDLTTREIAQELNVNYLLEGTVQKQGNQVKIHAQLILAKVEDHIWAHTYTEELSDVFKVQSQMAKSIADELIATITPEEMQRIERPPTNNQEAYDLYLRAVDYRLSYYSRYSDGSVTGLNSAIQLYQEAIELDPEFALAYVYLGEAIVVKTYDPYDENRADTSLYYINKALDINPDLADAYMLRGMYYLEKRMYEKGVLDLEKSIELNPNLGGAYSSLGEYYSSQQEYILALKYYNISRKIGIGDPEYRWTLSSIGSIYMDIGDYEKANTAFLEFVNHNPIGGYQQLYWLNLVNGKKDKTKFYEDKICALDSGFCLGIISDRYLDSRNYELALFYHEKYVQVANAKGLSGYDNPYEKGILYYKIGRTEEALEIFNKHIEGANNFINLERNKRTNSRAYGQIVGIYALLGERDKAYQYLYKLEEIITGETLRWIQHSSVYEDLWEDDEFKAYIKRNEKKLEEIRVEVDRLEREGMI